MPTSTFASAPCSGSTSGSGPESGSKRSLGTTSPMAPSRAPATSTWLTASRTIGSATSGLVPLATVVVASRGARASSAVSAASRVSSPRSSSSRSRASDRAPVGASDIEQSPSLERSAERDLVGVLEVAADRQAGGDPGDLQAHRPQQPGEVGGRGLPLEVGVGRDDDLGDHAVGEPGHQLTGAQVVRPDAVDRADRAAQHVVPAAELARLLDRDDVL